MKSERKENEIFDPHSVCIATATFYKNWYPGQVRNNEADVDKIRGDLALQLMKDSIESGFQLVNVDGGSSAEFLSEMSNMEVMWKKEEERGMSPSRRQAFREASQKEGVKIIVWTEPEKTDIVAKNIKELSMPILRAEADIVIPRRTEKTFATYPGFQVESEKRLNKDWNNVLRRFGLLKESDGDLDVAFGPKIFRNSPAVLSLFLARYEIENSNISMGSLVRPETYSNATFFPVIAGLDQGYKVESIEIDNFVYPPKQASMEKDSEEFRNKRRKQRTDIVTGAIEFCRFLKNDIKSRLRKL